MSYRQLQTIQSLEAAEKITINLWFFTKFQPIKTCSSDLVLNSVGKKKNSENLVETITTVFVQVAIVKILINKMSFSVFLNGSNVTSSRGVFREKSIIDRQMIHLFDRGSSTDHSYNNKIQKAQWIIRGRRLKCKKFTDDDAGVMTDAKWW